jgi:hypothetical protein
MRSTGLGIIGLGLALAACGGRAGSAQSNNRAAMSAASECPILTVADIQVVTGATVRPVPRGSSPGAGGTCANYTGADSHAYLGVNQLTTAAEYTASVAAVPTDIYPKQEKLTGIGDEGVLFSGPGGIRYLVARRGNAGVVIFPLTRDMSDQQLKGLAQRALAAH